jgi:cytochrome bd-type quinol oxidase subunit 1
MTVLGIGAVPLDSTQMRPSNEMSLTLAQHLLRMVVLFGGSGAVILALALLVLYLFWVSFVKHWSVDSVTWTHILPFPGCETTRVLEERERKQWTIKKRRNFANGCWRNTRS